MKKSLWFVWLLLPLVLPLTACSDDDDTVDANATWAARNAKWYKEIADSARTAIAEAKATHGDNWEAHCEWRMYKSLTKSPDIRGALTDSICIRYLQRGTGTELANSSDTVRIHFRGTLIPEKQVENGETKFTYPVFTQTYYGTFNPATAAPQATAVSNTVAGFFTALQYMREGDNCRVYIPHQLAYGGEATGSVPAYSTLAFHINLIGIYHPGTAVPPWK